MNKGVTGSERQREIEAKGHWLLLIVHAWPLQCRLPQKPLNGISSYCCWLLSCCCSVAKWFSSEKNVSENAHISTFWTFTCRYLSACAGFSITELQLLRIYSHTCWDYCAVPMHTTCATTPTQATLHAAYTYTVPFKSSLFFFKKW